MYKRQAHKFYICLLKEINFEVDDSTKNITCILKITNITIKL